MPNVRDHDHEEDIVTSGGSSFILNNTTYSGCDIKVVINIYDQGKLAQQDQIRRLTAAIDQATQQINTAQDTLSSIVSRAGIVKEGTNEKINLNRQLAQYQNFITIRQETITQLMERLAALQKKRSGASTKVLAEIQTLSASTARDKREVRSLGSVHPKAFCRGPRSVAGSMIFTVFNQHVLYEFLEAHASDFDAVAFQAVLLDQIPPVDISILFANEYGSVSRMGIYGVEFMNEGQVFSIEDLLTEMTVNYVARGIDPIRAVSQRKRDEISQQLSEQQTITASSLILEEDYQKIKNNISPYERFSRQRNPFI